MTKKEFILQFCIQNGCSTYGDGIITPLHVIFEQATRMANLIDSQFPQAFDNDDEQDRLTNAIEIALDHAQRNGGFAVQFNEKQHQ